MNRSLFRFLLLTIVCAAPLSVSRGEDSPKPVKPADEGKLLFDGKTLTNWKLSKFRGQGKVDVVEGALRLSEGKALTGVTWDGPALPKVDYEVTWEARRVEGTDFFCAVTFPVQDSSCSLVLGGWNGNITGLSSLDGADASENETSKHLDYEKGRWYKLRLKVTKEKIQAWLDDKVLADVEYKDRRVGIRIEVTPCEPFGFSTYNTVGELRNIRHTVVK